MQHRQKEIGMSQNPLTMPWPNPVYRSGNGITFVPNACHWKQSSEWRFKNIKFHNLPLWKRRELIHLKIHLTFSILKHRHDEACVQYCYTWVLGDGQMGCLHGVFYNIKCLHFLIFILFWFPKSYVLCVLFSSVIFPCIRCFLSFLFCDFDNFCSVSAILNGWVRFARVFWKYERSGY